mmetsp:Transcript_150693/g.484388  ORF Transcript_150693/g.484388 Transcript_150693/m.484388 type:complete len:240 (+) Transcript_150693:70-789(+)
MASSPEPLHRPKYSAMLQDTEKPIESLDLDVVLFQGRIGEECLEGKASGADNIAMLSALLLAYSVEQIFSLKEEDFQQPEIFLWFGIPLGLAAGSGLASVLILAFLAIKIRRLAGRSWCQFGRDVDAALLERKYGDREILQSALRPFTQNNSVGEVRFHAREWYYHPDNKTSAMHGLTLFQAGFFMFGIEVLCVTILLVARIIDAWANTFKMTMALLTVVPLLLAFGALLVTGSLHDLA